MITFNGRSVDELLGMSDEDLERFVVSGETMVFQAGTADVLGRFWVHGGSLVLELGHIDGGGEGVLPAIAVVAQRYATRRGLARTDWRVHAVKCARPNLKIRRLMGRRGFHITNVPGTGTCYHNIRAVVQAAHGNPG